MSQYTFKQKKFKNVEGVFEIIEQLNEYLSRMSDLTLAGLIRAAALIRWETEHGPRRTPVDYGNLRASWFVVTAKGKIARGGGATHTPTGATGKFSGPKGGMVAAEHAAMLTAMKGKAQNLVSIHGGPFIIMGYSANYTWMVHEMLSSPSGGDIKWSRKKSGPKWFEMALKKHQRNILKVVRGGKVKGFTKNED